MVLNIGMLQHSPQREIQGMGEFVYSFEGRMQVSRSSTYISIVFDPISTHILVKLKKPN